MSSLSLANTIMVNKEKAVLWNIFMYHSMKSFRDPEENEGFF